MSCNYCRKPGHFKKSCPQLLNKSVDPAYESAMKKGLNEPLTKEEERAVNAKNRARLYAAEHRKAFLEREQHRKKPDEDHGAYMFRCFKHKRDSRTVARVVTSEEQEQWLRDEREYFEEMKRDRESSALWEKEEEEREARRAKMTLRERVLDEHKQDEEELEEWEALCSHEESAQYYAECFRAEK